MYQTLFLIIFCTVVSVQAKFPDDPKPCKYGDSVCLEKIINYYLNAKGKEGDRDINMVKLDPFRVAKMNIKQGAESPVNIDLTMTDNEVLGLSTITISKVKGFGKDLATKHEMSVTVPKLAMLGPYTIKGKVLILPIGGSGNSNMTIVDCVGKLIFMGKPYEKNGETYMEATNLKLVTKPGRMYFDFTNLFNGDKALGDNMNLFLNENWEAIFAEVQQSMHKAFGEIFEAIITNVFSKYPYEKYFEQ